MNALVLKLLAQRISLGLVLIFFVSIMIFLGTQILPGDVAQAILGQSATPESLANLREELGLNIPAYQRYLSWLGGVLQGDLGTSLTNGRDIGQSIADRMGNTLFLAAWAAIISVFMMSYILMYYVAVQLGWAPSVAMLNDRMSMLDKLHAISLPIAVLVMVVLAHMMRMTRAALLNVMQSAYIETAELKGIRRSSVIWRHAFPNSIAPIVNVVMLNMAYLVVGVVVVEVVFVYPGMGQYLVDHVAKRDVPVVQACGLIFAAVYIFLNMFADIVSILANPRLRHPK